MPFALFFQPVPAVVARAQDTAKTTAYPTQLDLSVPSSAALSLLGVSPSKALSPSSLQEVAGGIIHSFDESGHLKDGVALNVPIYHFSRFDVDLLTRNPLDRAFYLTNLSAAYVQGNGEDKSSRAAFSVSVPFVDRTDWRTDKRARAEWDALVVVAIQKSVLPIIPAAALAKETALQRLTVLQGESVLLLAKPDLKALVDAAIAAIQSNAPQLPAGTRVSDLPQPVLESAWQAIRKPYDAVYQKRDEISVAILAKVTERSYPELIERFDKSHWNARKIELAGAYSLFSEKTTSSGLRGEGAYAWLSWSEPLGPGQLTAFGKYANKDRTWDDGGKLWEIANRTSFGGRYRFGSKDGGAFIEYLQSLDDVRGKSNQVSQLLQGGYEFKLNSGQWLQFSLGQGSGLISKTVFGLSFNLNFSTTRGIDERGNVVTPKL